MTHLNDISKIYLEQITEKKDDSYLETDMKKRQKNNEKAVADMKKVKDDTVPRWMKEAKKLDPVGQEDADIDNDGDVDKSDKYLHKKRKAIGKAISKKKGEDEEDEEEVEESVIVKRKTLGSRFKNEAERQAYLKKLDQKSKERRLNKLRATVEEVEEAEQIDELRITKLADKSKVKERAKNIKSIRDKKAHLSDLMKHYKGMKSGIYNSYEPEGESVDEKIDVRKQSSKRKSLGRGSSINPDAKKTGYESPAEFRKTEKKLAPYMEAKNVHGEVEVPSGNIGKLAKKASKRIDTDVDGDVEHNDKHKGEYGEFVPSPDGKKKVFTGSKKVTKESFSNWRQDLIEVADEDGEKQIKEMPKNQKNKISINPKLGEAVEGIGGTLIEMIELDEFDFVLESVYDELIEEGYSEDDVEEAIEFVLTQDLSEASDKYYDSAVRASKKAGAKIKRAEMMKKAKGRLRYLGRKAKEKVGSAKKKAGMASAQAQVAAYNKGREVKQAVADKTRAKKQGLKRFVKKAAQKVVDRMSEENVEEAYTVTAADKKGNTKAYQNYKAGMKGKDGKPLYKAADHLGEQKVSESNMSPERLKKINDRISKMGILYPTGKKKKTSVALRKEKEASMKEEASMSQQELMLQKKKARIDKMIAMKRSQELNKTKSGDQPAKAMGEGLSVDQQMKISQKYNRMSPEEKKAANKKAMGNVKKVAPKKDTRTDAQKMTDATGPRPGSRYRGD